LDEDWRFPVPITKKKDPRGLAEIGSSAGDFWRRHSLEELARQQGVRPVERLEDLVGGWPEDEIDDGFEEALLRWRGHSPDEA
jgi:hypothetical protein